MTPLALLCAIAVQDPPKEYVEAERTMRRVLETLGVSTDDAKVDYTQKLDKGVRGDMVGDELRVSRGRSPENIKTIYHEFWHFGQQEMSGGQAAFQARYEELNRRFGYEKNPLEREAREFADFLEPWIEFRKTWLRRLTHRGDANFEMDLARGVRRLLPGLRRQWKGSPVHPEHLDRLEERVRAMIEFAPRGPKRGARLGRAALRESGSLASFGAAYLIKEGLNALGMGDPGRMKASALAMKEPEFLLSVGGFTAVSGLTDAGLRSARAPGMIRAVLPLTAGMAALQVAHGRFSPAELGIATVSFASVAAGMEILMPIPQVRIVGGLLKVVKLAWVLYLGEHLDRLARAKLLGRTNESGPPRTGIAEKMAGFLR